MKTIFIIRGLPGSGKSTLAACLKALVEDALVPAEERGVPALARHPGPDNSAVCCSEDDYWTDEDGCYHFDPSTRDAAYMVMTNAAVNQMSLGRRCIIIHTAALRLDGLIWHIILGMAKHCGYQIFPLIIQRNTENPPSVHDVLPADMDYMRQEMEHGLEVTF